MKAPPEWLSSFLADLPSAVALFDRGLRYIAANGPWLDVFGIDGAALRGRHHHDLDPRSGPVIAELLRRALNGEIVEACEIGEPDPANRSRRFVLSARRRRATDTADGIIAAVHEVALEGAVPGLREVSDQLTGLAGRHRFMAHVRSVLVPRDPWRPTAVFLLDIDNFKGVNDLYGAGIGDGVLKIIANRLLAGTRSRPLPADQPGRSAAERSADMVARLGADEFGIALGNPAPTLADAEAFARRLLQLVANPVMIGTECIRLSASIGYIVTSPTHRNEDDALRDLDVAL